MNPHAFPHHFQLASDVVDECKGMTLRDYFASMAMQLQPWHDLDDNYLNHADRCYSMADAMLKARQE